MVVNWPLLSFWLLEVADWGVPVYTSFLDKTANPRFFLFGRPFLNQKASTSHCLTKRPLLSVPEIPNTQCSKNHSHNIWEVHKFHWLGTIRTKYTEYNDGLKLRMPHPFRTRCPKECRRGGKILKNPGKMQFSGTCNFTGTFFNESFVGKFCENLQRNMRLSATHRMPPAKSPGRSMSNIWSPYFQNTRYTRGFMYFVQPT